MRALAISTESCGVGCPFIAVGLCVADGSTVEVVETEQLATGVRMPAGASYGDFDSLCWEGFWAWHRDMLHTLTAGANCADEKELCRRTWGFLRAHAGVPLLSDRVTDDVGALGERMQQYDAHHRLCDMPVIGTAGVQTAISMIPGAGAVYCACRGALAPRAGVRNPADNAIGVVRDYAAMPQTLRCVYV